MEKSKPFTIEDISLTWLTLGGLVVCASILLSVIYVTKPLIRKTDSAAGKPYVLTAQARTLDSASLYPPQ